MKNIVKSVDEFAELSHRNQKRWDGSPYIAHPRAVGRFARALATKFWPTLSEEELDIFEVMGLAHDLAEDQAVSEDYFISLLYASGYGDSHDLERLRIGLKILNKNNYPDYLAFTLAAKANGEARVVKIADITHNSSDIKKGSMSDKYKLALWILEH